MFKINNNIYGINKSKYTILQKKLGYNIRFKPSLLRYTAKTQLINIIGKKKLGRRLKQYNRDRIFSLIDIRSYRGMRHKRGLPVRGQRTHTNAKTSKSRPKLENERNGR